MRFEITTKSLDTLSSDAALLFAFATGDEKKSSFVLLDPAKELDKQLDGEITRTCELENFTAKRGELLTIVPGKKTLPSRIVVIGLGRKKEFIANDIRRAAGVFSKQMKKNIDSASVVFSEELQNLVDLKTLVQAFAEGILLGKYEFMHYKKKKADERNFASVIISAAKSDEKTIKEAVDMAELYANATVLARDLVNEPPTVATPTYLAKLAQDIAKKNPKLVSCTIYNKAQCEKMGMHAFLAIARAADGHTEPKFIFLQYSPSTKAKSKKKLAIVGKGITFDSGGINVKPGDHMKDMKMDMSGAAAVLGVFSVIADIKPDFPVIGLVAATPNLISSTSIVPGDVARAMNGKTIEILNTDAEGRVTMADSLSFAVKEKATEIIDLATLTGACMVALGEDVAGLFVNNEDFGKRIKSAAHDAGERMWELPLEKEYKKLNKSDVADIANIPVNRYGGTITAALFLEEFIEDQAWAHLDIAGPAFLNKQDEVNVKGGTGYGVRTLLHLLQTE